MSKFALIHLGNEESYGLLFVAGELKRMRQFYKFFDGDNIDIAELINYHPDYICLSPMSVFYEKALMISKAVDAISVFGGHHAMATPTTIDADVVVVGTCVGAIARILAGERGIINQPLLDVNDLPEPDRRSYYTDVPRMRGRYRKIMLSVLGCPWACTYCSSSMPNTIKRIGKECIKVYLQHRDINRLIDEAKYLLKHDTVEIEWVDDDILYGDKRWLIEFMNRWKNDIGLPMYTSSTSYSVLNATKDQIDALKLNCRCVGLGIQSTQDESLKLLGRRWDNIKNQIDAYNKLVRNGFRVNPQAIVGLPIGNPVEDAIQTVSIMARYFKGSVASVYPLQLYPGTAIRHYCIDNGYELNPNGGDTNTGITGVKFDEVTTKRIKNICKIATMAIKFGMTEDWIRTLIDIDYDDETSKSLSKIRYKECIIDRLGYDGIKIYNSIMETTNIKY